MSMTDWAEKEIEIACARERANSKEEGDWDYGCACYESALKAFKSLLDDGHSGFSIGITKQILIRLIDGKPLTPIEDTPDVWNRREALDRDGYQTYQCTRMSSLFKHVHTDGTITYSDVNRVRCVDIDNKSVCYTNGFITNLIDEMYPITMPYNPGKIIKVVCEDFLTNPKNGDYDTKGVLYILKEKGMRQTIGRYFKESESDFTFVEISHAEYLERKLIAKALKGE